MHNIRQNLVVLFCVINYRQRILKLGCHDNENCLVLLGVFTQVEAKREGGGKMNFRTMK